jgi:hypothetical protein
LKSAGPTAARDYFKDNVVAPVAEHPFTATLEGCGTVVYQLEAQPGQPRDTSAQPTK